MVLVLAFGYILLLLLLFEQGSTLIVDLELWFSVGGDLTISEGIFACHFRGGGTGGC